MFPEGPKRVPTVGLVSGGRTVGVSGAVWVPGGRTVSASSSPSSAGTSIGNPSLSVLGFRLLLIMSRHIGGHIVTVIKNIPFAVRSFFHLGQRAYFEGCLLTKAF